MANWIKEFHRDKCQTFLCSECGTRVYYIDNESRGRHPKSSKCRYTFCPWCKAEMDIDKPLVRVEVVEEYCRRIEDED